MFIFVFKNTSFESWRQRDKGKDRDILHLLAHSPEGHNSQQWGTENPGAPLKCSTWVQGEQAFEPYSSAFALGMGSAWDQTGAQMGCQHYRFY